MTDDDIARLRGLAQAATPGPWEAAETPSGKGKVLCGGVFSVCNTTAGPYKQQRADAAYIAAASPDVLLRLLDALDEARRGRDDSRAKERRALREAFDAVRERDEELSERHLLTPWRVDGGQNAAHGGGTCQ